MNLTKEQLADVIHNAGCLTKSHARVIANAISEADASTTKAQPEPLFVFEHEDGRRITCRADDARLVGEQAWHRVGPAPTDAERYQWIRRENARAPGGRWFAYQDPEKLDTAIDAAMRATPADGGEG